MNITSHLLFEWLLVYSNNQRSNNNINVLNKNHFYNLDQKFGMTLENEKPAPLNDVSL
jgi:hypothetical protein